MGGDGYAGEAGGFDAPGVEHVFFVSEGGEGGGGGGGEAGGGEGGRCGASCVVGGLFLGGFVGVSSRE